MFFVVQFDQDCYLHWSVSHLRLYLFVDWYRILYSINTILVVELNISVLPKLHLSFSVDTNRLKQIESHTHIVIKIKRIKMLSMRVLITYFIGAQFSASHVVALKLKLRPSFLNRGKGQNSSPSPSVWRLIDLIVERTDDLNRVVVSWPWDSSPSHSALSELAGNVGCRDSSAQ